MSLVKTIATFGCIGYLPAAGTIASFVCFSVVALIKKNFFSLSFIVARHKR